jgi:hypothetical protein
MSEVIIIATLANYKHFTFLTCRHDSVIVGQSKNVVFGTWGQHILTIFGIIQTFIIIQHFERVKKIVPLYVEMRQLKFHLFKMPQINRLKLNAREKTLLAGEKIEDFETHFCKKMVLNTRKIP